MGICASVVLANFANVKEALVPKRDEVLTGGAGNLRLNS